MMKKSLAIISLVLLAAALLWGGYFSWQNLRGAPPALPPPAGHNPIAADPASLPLKLPRA